MTCWAITTPGLEPLLEGELQSLGLVVGVSEPGGATFEATAAELARALIGLRTASRVAVRLAAFHARSFAELERHAAKVAWGDVIAPGHAVHFRVTSRKSKLYHQDGIAERLERAVVLQHRTVEPVRAPSRAEEIESPRVDPPPLQRILVRVMRDEVVLSADAAGALMHLRGYRQAVAKAPLRETLAAALLLASGWDTSLPLADPFCGSGTIAIEAAMIARRLPPGRTRRFAAENWPGFAPAFVTARAEGRARELPAAPASIAASDRDGGAIEAIQANAERAGVPGDISVTRATISALPPDDKSGWIVTNPPYGARIGERTALRDLYATLGRVLTERRPAWRLAMLSADRMLEAQTRLRLTEVLRTTNGGIPVRVVSTGERRENGKERSGREARREK
ncbi:MAG: THUMP domain-containing class I SAM-dependent RNA methyltransferase [Gemmatimonadales bacterium]